METNRTEKSFSWSKASAVGSIALTLCAASLRVTAQDQAGPPPTAAPQTEGRPAPDNQSLPSTPTLPAGTVISARVLDWLSSDKSRPGDSFTASLEQPLVANGWVVARRGQFVTGRVVHAQKAPRGGGESQLAVELIELTTVDGQVLPVRTQLVESSVSTPRGPQAAAVGATTGIGAAIGAIAGEGEGAAIGAGIGAVAGLAGVLSTRGRLTVIFPESLLSFRLQVPLAISATQGQLAFQPASQADYGHDQDAYAHRPRRTVYGPRLAPYYGPYPFAYRYPYPYAYSWGYYPPPTYLDFGFYVFRPEFRGRFRGFRRY